MALLKRREQFKTGAQGEEDQMYDIWKRQNSMGGEELDEGWGPDPETLLGPDHGSGEVYTPVKTHPAVHNQ